MTVSVAPRYQNFVGSNTTGPFTFNFPILIDNSGVPQIRVTKISAAGAATVLSYPSDYSFTAVSLGLGGGIVNTTNLVANDGSRLFIEAVTPLDQAVAYRNQGKFYPETHELSYDKLTYIAQESARTNSLAVRIPSTDVTGTSTTLPTAAQRAGLFLGFDASGNVIAASVTGTLISAAMTPVVQSGTLFDAEKLLYNGTVSGVALSYTGSNVLGSFAFSVNSYAQQIIQNKTNGTTASSDLVVNNDVSTDTTFYGNFGMNSSGFTGSGNFNKASAVYLTSTSGDLVIGSTTANAIHFVYNNSTTDTAFIDATGLNVITQSAGNNSTRAASTAYVDSAIAAFTGIIKSVKAQTFTSTGTYTPSAGMAYCIVEVQAAGGAGGGNTGGGNGSSGGGAGANSSGLLTAATVGASKAVTLGAAGTGVSGANGNDGAQSSFGTLIVCNGGKGGIIDSGARQPGGLGGTVATAGNLSATPGQSGFPSLPSGNGISGLGGSCPRGAGGASQNLSTAGQPGLGYGSGGSAAINTTAAGGNGAGPIIIITEFCTQ